jgi:hypothetical protein
MTGIVKSNKLRNDSSHLNLEAWLRSFLSANLFSEFNNRPSDLGHQIGVALVLPARSTRGAPVSAA